MEKAALFIDAENFSYKHVNQLFTELEKKDINLSLKLAFADWSQNNLNTQDWKKTLNKLSIRPQHLFNFSSGKNASDIQMVIHAMKLLYTDPSIDTFIIATSDGDFTPLVLTLKENGKKVIGFGNAVSSQVLSDSCDEYYMLQLKPQKNKNEVKTDITNNDTNNETEIKPNRDKIHNILFSIWDQCLHDEFGWVNFDYINRIASKAYQSFSHQSYGYDSIKELIQDQKTFEMLKNENLNHVDHYFRPRKKLNDILIKHLDEIYFKNIDSYYDENWLNIDSFNDLKDNFNIKEHGYSHYLKAIEESYLYEVRLVENKGTFFRRKMTKNHRHILLLFLKSWNSGNVEKDNHGYSSLEDLQQYIKQNYEEDFSIKKYKLNSLIKALKAIYPLDIISTEKNDRMNYHIKPKYIK
jgi:uncharacterized LabA/DUF88 family protein